MRENCFTTIRQAQSLLEEKGLDTHAVWLLMEQVKGQSYAQLLTNLQRPLTEKEACDFWRQMDKLLTGQPVQQIIGTTNFYNCTLTVNQHVLIPRPETEELVDGALKRAKKRWQRQSIRVADIGTGSGAIAIAFQKEWPEAKVTGTDISSDALTVARKNAQQNEVDVTFVEGHLSAPIAHEKWDIILSNPPYIAYEEADQLSKTVIDFEPHTALFADDNGLFFYRQLLQEIPAILARPALVGFEIGHTQGAVVEQLCHQAFPDAKVERVKDMNGKDRIIFCEID